MWTVNRLHIFIRVEAVWEHADGSMYMGACRLEQSTVKKVMTFDFFQFAWNGEQGSNYLFYYLVTDNIFV